MDLAEFLLARIAEDEAAARWVQASERIADAEGKPGSVVLLESGAYARPDSPHVALGDPARVRAECEAKRRIVERWQETAPTVAAWGGTPGWADAYTQAVNETLTEDVLPWLALPYADHPDYQQRWKPYAGASATV